ncbi:general odorant-binding protein 72 [Fopius arisanus]|uniref:General odorant-binding protein 72 n=1 Tax=Fopius arisanus TaxID=64838 RepID=A0A0C9PWB3_9HYME|nr:PREDICTED: general odorant-binding protein 72-like [Fopius arisanus]
MKLLVALLVLHVGFASAAFTGADLVRFQRTLEKCRNRHNVRDEILERVVDREIVDDPNFNCFVSCLLEGHNLLTEDGSLNVPVAMSLIPQDADFAQPLTHAFNTCSTRRDPDKCKTAQLLFACMHENKIPDLLFG